MTNFKTALSLCGLSQQGAADFLGIRLDTVKKFCAGTSRPSLGIWKLLANLFEQIQDAANSVADHMSLEDIDPRTFNELEADVSGNELPTPSTVQAAGVMALLRAIRDLEEVE